MLLSLPGRLSSVTLVVSIVAQRERGVDPLVHPCTPLLFDWEPHSDAVPARELLSYDIRFRFDPRLSLSPVQDSITWENVTVARSGGIPLCEVTVEVHVPERGPRVRARLCYG